MRLLLIEDDKLLGHGIQTGLRQENCIVDWLQDGVSGEHAWQLETYDAIILDWNLPKKDGISILNTMRHQGDITPVLLLTARDTLDDKVVGLDSGADDYLVKPFDLEELLARLRALIRRNQGRAIPQIYYADLCLDPAAHTLTQADNPVKLSNKELLILQILLENIGKVMSRQQLEDSLYGWNEEIESNAVEVFIHHLRKKLGKQIILTIRGIGYTIPKL
ncbi:MAG: response regulator transcription factor [Thiotrichaceae bacterium]|nr:response regulator transcription factor [Thiotrichaceae bacterium]